MADDKERTYNIPLRKEWLKVPIYKRTSKAIRAIREFMKKHMKTEDIKLGKYLNLEVWKHGYKNPPHKISVTAKWIEEKDKKYVQVEIVGAPEEKKEEKKGGKKSEKKEDKKEEKKEEKKTENKEEKKETKKEEKPKKEGKKEDPKKK